MLGNSHALRNIVVVAACMLWDSHALRITVVAAAGFGRITIFSCSTSFLCIISFVCIVSFSQLPEAEDELARSAIAITIALEELLDHLALVIPMTFVLVDDAAFQLIFVVFFHQWIQFHYWSNSKTTMLFSNAGSLLIWTIWMPLLLNECLPPSALAICVI